MELRSIVVLKILYFRFIVLCVVLTYFSVCYVVISFQY